MGSRLNLASDSCHKGEAARFEASSAPETIKLNRTSSFQFQSHKEREKAGEEPIESAGDPRVKA
jgi:hypothetical protein